MNIFGLDLIAQIVLLVVVGYLQITLAFVSTQVPAERFKPSSFPYRLFAFEKNGAIYQKLFIKFLETIFARCRRICARRVQKKTSSIHRRKLFANFYCGILPSGMGALGCHDSISCFFCFGFLVDCFFCFHPWSWSQSSLHFCTAL